MICILMVATGCTSQPDEAVPTAPPPTALPTVQPGALTVGDLITQVDRAWPNVTSVQTTFWSQTGNRAGTPPTTGAVTVEYAVLPSARHVMQTMDGSIVDEQIALDGRVYMKGEMVVAAIAPMVGTDTWIEVDPATATSSSPVAAQVAYLRQPVVPPFGDVSPETRSLQAFPAGEISVGDRTCTKYSFGDRSGSGIHYALALDSEHLPCQLVQSAGGYMNVTLYAFNLPNLTIAAPNVATPPPVP